MTDRAVPNLPSRDLGATAEFYGGFGFRELHRDDGWLVLRRGDLQLEFFRKDDLEPHGQDFACCLRVADLQGLYDAVRAAGVPQATRATERAPNRCAALGPGDVHSA